MSQRTDANWTEDDIRAAQLEAVEDAIADLRALVSRVGREDRTEVFSRIEYINEWLKGIQHKDQVFGRMK